MRACLGPITVLLVATCGASSAGATTMVELPLDQMIADAEIVVHGVVESTGTRVVLENGEATPVTVTRIKPLAWLKGEGGSHVELREVGGRYRGGELRVEGTPRFHVDEEVVLFLERGPSGGLRTYGMVQGKFEVRPAAEGTPKTVVRDFEELGLVRWSDGQMHLRAGGKEPASTLEDLLTYIEARVSREADR